MQVHRIYLRQPWKVAEKSAEGVTLLRRFHTPTGLSATTRVWLILESLPKPASLLINGRAVDYEEMAERNGEAAEQIRERVTRRFDITNLLDAAPNLVEIRFPIAFSMPEQAASPSPSEELPGLGGKVYLEIWEDSEHEFGHGTAI